MLHDGDSTDKEVRDAEERHSHRPEGRWEGRQTRRRHPRLVHHDRKVDALDAGRTTARRDGVELVTHGKNGRIQDSDSHGRDPFPPRG